METWKVIDGIGLISNYGSVKTLRSGKLRDRKLCTDKGGYKSVQLTDGMIKRKHMVHVLVAQYFIANPYNKTEVNHIDSNPSNNHVSNLEWVTPLENVHHAMINSYKTRNGKHWKSKISTQDADFIRDNFKKRYSAKELSSMFGLDLSTVYSLLRGETWKQHNDKRTIFRRSAKLE